MELSEEPWQKNVIKLQKSLYGLYGLKDRVLIAGTNG